MSFCVLCFLHSFTCCWTLGHLYFLAVIGSTVTSIDMQPCLQGSVFSSSGYILRDEVAKWHSHFIFNSRGKSCFLQVHIPTNSTQGFLPHPPPPHQHSSFSLCLMVDTLGGSVLWHSKLNHDLRHQHQQASYYCAWECNGKQFKWLDLSHSYGSSWLLASVWTCISLDRNWGNKLASGKSLLLCLSLISLSVFPSTNKQIF